MGVDGIGYTAAMIAAIRSAVLQARVRPEFKFASERVLHRMGLTMTEAMELFMRRLIIEQKLPFEVVALDDRVLDEIVDTWEEHSKKRLAEKGTEKRRTRSVHRRE